MIRWDYGLAVQMFMYFAMVSLFISEVFLVVYYCCLSALAKRTMRSPLLAEAREWLAGK